MAFSLAEFLERHRSRIIEEWSSRLLKGEVCNLYAMRPREELLDSIGNAVDANYRILIHDDFSRANLYIRRVVSMRLHQGFLVSDMQKSWELYRTIVLPLLVQEVSIREYYRNVEKLNRCLAYTIHQFSDHFQEMHNKQLLEHAEMLEEQVRKRTSELSESERKYKTLVEEIEEGYFIIRIGCIYFANGEFCRMHGYDLSELLAMRFHELVAEKDRFKIERLFREAARQKGPINAVGYQRMTRDHQIFPTEIKVKMTEYDGHSSIMGICRDVTERTVMERKMREDERMAYIGRISASLSHEIRNPLSAVKMNLQILQKNINLNRNDRRRVDISAAEITRLETFLEEILDFARPLQPQKGRCNVNAIVESCLEVLESRCKEKEVCIVKSLRKRMPDLYADRFLLFQAFMNLLINAIEASPINSEIEVVSAYKRNSSRKRTGTVEFCVHDNGPGIPEQNMADLFTPFFTTKSKGTGLGLTNVMRIIESHYGRVEVKNRFPGGASFRVYIPKGVQ